MYMLFKRSVFQINGHMFKRIFWIVRTVKNNGKGPFEKRLIGIILHIVLSFFFYAVLSQPAYVLLEIISFLNYIV